ncbi:hypothetical protein HGRIS_012569 [Hohenbuehelia grisea]|uniref:Uncharacterized protein n=1 Tax=Hohenbuehelia grisea TaxID=104357 RepID=A0ABR3ISY2_9AGAR
MNMANASPVPHSLLPGHGESPRSSPVPHSLLPGHGESPRSHISPNAYRNAHFPTQPAGSGLGPPSPPADNLGDPGRDTFNVDPASTYMGTADDEAIAQQLQAEEMEESQRLNGPGLPSSKRFVGGFLVEKVKNAMRTRGPTPDTQRAADAEVQRAWGGVPPIAGPSRRRRPTYPHGYVPYDEAQQIQAGQQQQQDPPLVASPSVQFVTSNGLPISAPLPLRRGSTNRRPHRPAPPDGPPTPLSSSEESQTHGGTTAVSHSDHTHVQVFPPLDVGVLGSPILAEPRPASDYAKMSSLGSASAAGISFHTHMRRLRRWVASVNALPWIATERVTIDYIPKAARARLAHHPTQQHTFGLQRPLSSWYGTHADRMSIDLLSGESMSPSPPTAYPILPYDGQDTLSRGITIQAPAPMYTRRYPNGAGYAPFQLPEDGEPVYYVPMVQTQNAPVTFVTSSSVGHG